MRWAWPWRKNAYRVDLAAATRRRSTQHEHSRTWLERAARRILETDASITSVAFDAGYETHESFTRAFHKAYGVPPSWHFQKRIARARGRCGASAHVRAPPREAAFTFPPPEIAKRVIGKISGEMKIQFSHGEDAMKVDIIQLSAMRVATIRHTGPYPRISEAFREARCDRRTRRALRASRKQK